MAVEEDTSLFDLLWQVTAHTHLMAEAALADTPLSVATSTMLLTIDDDPGTTVAEVSRRMPKTQQALSQVVARLEKDGLVERRVGPGRGVRLHLTEEGQAQARVARERLAEVGEQLETMLGTKQAGQLERLLTQSRARLAR